MIYIVHYTVSVQCTMYIIMPTEHCTLLKTSLLFIINFQLPMENN